MAKQRRYPTTFTATDNGGWANPENVASSNNTYATADVASSVNIGTTFSGFDFSINSYSITSIKVYVEHKISGDTFQNWLDYTIYNDGVSQEVVNYPRPLPTEDTLVSFDITSYFTEADLNNDKLSINAYALNVFSSRVFYIDTLYVEVEYIRKPAKASGQII